MFKIEECIMLISLKAIKYLDKNPIIKSIKSIIFKMNKALIKL